MVIMLAFRRVFLYLYGKQQAVKGSVMKYFNESNIELVILKKQKCIFMHFVAPLIFDKCMIVRLRL